MTASWLGGYVGDVPYTLGYYRELAPSFLHYACTACGVEGLPDSRKVRFAELGSGRGYGTALLAAANPDMDFVGIDFNPTHVAEARAFAKRAGLANVEFIESSFGDAADSRDPKLSDFDVVALHGVYSWIEPKVRDDINRFLRNALVPGGIAYVSYNCMPGWASVVPMQRLLMEVANRSTGDSIAQIRKGMETLKQLADKASGFVVQNPALKVRLSKMDEQDIRYLAHEFLNTGWQPLFITDVMAMFSEAKLTYVGSATIGENRIELCVPAGLREMVAAAPDLPMRELLKDYVLNKQFRRDIFVKGQQRLTPRAQRERLSEQLFGLVYAAKEPPKKLRIPLGEFTPKKEVIAEIFGAMSGKCASGAEIAAAAKKAGAREESAWTLLEVLVHCGLLYPARRDGAKVDAAAARRLNQMVIEMALAADTHRFLASPLLGSAISAGFLDRIAAPLVMKDRLSKDVQIAQQTFARLDGSGQKLWRSGKPLERNDENLQEVARLVRDFREVRLPRWRTLRVLE